MRATRNPPIPEVFVSNHPGSSAQSRVGGLDSFDESGWLRQIAVLEPLVDVMTNRWMRPIAAAGLMLVLQVPCVSAREELTSISDLKRLESRVEAVAEMVIDSTVALLSEKTGSSGSGVIVSGGGLILTAAHVVQGAEQMLVVFPNGRQVKARVLGANYSKDIAMAQIDEPGDWPALELGKSDTLEAGDWVVALGHSTGFDASRPPPVRFGRVISLGPGNFLTTDCTLIGGDSGGPLFDLDGKVIAIHSSIGRSLRNNNHAGIDGFREDWARLIEGQTWGKLSLNPFANPEMPVLGIGMAMVRGLEGVLVESVVQGSPAAAAGVRQGDVIRSLDGSRVRNGAELLQILAKHEAGDRVVLGLERDRGKLDVEVELKRRSELFDMR